MATKSVSFQEGEETPQIDVTLSQSVLNLPGARIIHVDAKHGDVSGSSLELSAQGHGQNGSTLSLSSRGPDRIGSAGVPKAKVTSPTSNKTLDIINEISKDMTAKKPRRAGSINSLNSASKKDSPKSILLPSGHRQVTPPDRLYSVLENHHSSANLRDLGQPVGLDTNSTSDDFTNFLHGLKHPGILMNIMARDDDPEIHSIFDDLCNELIASVGELEASLDDISQWKDDFLRQSVPSSVKLELAVLFAKLYRSKSDLHQPVFDLIQQVRLFSRPWKEKRHALLKLERDYHTHHQVLDICIRKVEHLEATIKKMKVRRQISLWERFAYRVMDTINHAKSGTSNVVINGLSPEIASFRGVQDAAGGAMSHLSQEQQNQERQRLYYQTPAPDQRRKSSSDKQAQLNLVNAAQFAKLKSKIRAYITDEPEWCKNSRLLVKHFIKMMKKKNPVVFAYHKEIMKRPLAKSQAKIPYLSTKAGTIETKLSGLPRTRAISAQPLSRLRKYEEEMHMKKEEVDRLRTLYDREVDEFGFEVYAQGDTPGARIESIFKLARSNSEGCLYDLGKKAQLKRPLKIQGKTFEFDGDEHDESDGSSASFAESEDEDGYSDLDAEFFARFNASDLQDTINSFFETHPNKEWDTTAEVPSEEQIAEPLDTSREIFSMKEVMELTLLHAQQMNLLQSEYEERIVRMAGQLETLQESTVKANQENEKRISDLQEMLQRQATMPAAIINLPDDGFPTGPRDRLPSITSNSRRASKSETVTKEISEDKLERNGSLSRSKGSLVPLNDSMSRPIQVPFLPEKKRTPSSKRKSVTPDDRTQDKMKPLQRKPKPAKKILPSIRPPKFTSQPMEMNFMERLKWFTEMSLKKKRQTHEEISKKEMELNEQKLSHLRLIKSAETGEDTENMALKAEFMPMPGTPSHTSKQNVVLTEHAITPPWGGRFKSFQGKSKMNVLNLFDVALSIQSKPPLSQPPSRGNM